MSEKIDLTKLAVGTVLVAPAFWSAVAASSYEKEEDNSVSLYLRDFFAYCSREVADHLNAQQVADHLNAQQKEKNGFVYCDQSIYPMQVKSEYIKGTPRIVQMMHESYQRIHKSHPRILDCWGQDFVETKDLSDIGGKKLVLLKAPIEMSTSDISSGYIGNGRFNREFISHDFHVGILNDKGCWSEGTDPVLCFNIAANGIDKRDGLGGAIRMNDFAELAPAIEFGDNGQPAILRRALSYSAPIVA